MTEGSTPTPQGRRTRFQEAPIDGQAFKELAEAGMVWLRTNCQLVNNLNVFPVPDGDTGTNMLMTMQAAFGEIADLPEQNVGKVISALAHGALMGARGNSGVILSQLWRGFARALDDQPVLTPALVAQAFAEARDTAYRGVVRPVEGTILTVAKDMAACAKDKAGEVEDVIVLFEEVVEAADASVEFTPELLPILKEAGVVDSGGKGLYFIFEGMMRYINGQSLETPVSAVQSISAMNFENTLDVVEPGQDYEVIVDFRPHETLNLQTFYSDLEEMGTSIQVGEGEGMYRMHIHVPTEKRYEPIDYTMSIGTITKVYIENLMDQMEEIEQKAGSKLKLTPLDPGQIAVVTVAPGPGIARVFASLGVAAIVAGGQTMNPSTQEILAAFESLPTDQVIILPNNKNIIMAAKSASELTVKKVAVIECRTVPQGLAAMLCLNPEGEFEDVVADMVSALGDVETGEITTASRNVEIDGVDVKEGQIIALHNGSLVLATSDLLSACLGFLEKAEADDYELITLFHGENVTKNEANRIADEIRAIYPEHEIEIQDGGQPHYQFIFSLE